ncbi:MAG TPA: DUF84 family protein [Bacillaceae bacterium]|nr:DUF84 family protein [Paenibacillus bovis]HLU22826.1 DUF84 family protein [Bacillaceae bacterium]
MNIAIGSKNKAKINAAKLALDSAELIHTLFPIDAPSSVSDMPFSDEETMRGAVNRAEYCLLQADVEMAFGLEGGVTETSYGLYLINYGALAEKGKETILSGGARIKLPEIIASKLRNGQVLGNVMEEYCKRENIRSNEGAIGIFTNGLIDRTEMFTHICKLLIGQRQYSKDN